MKFHFFRCAGIISLGIVGFLLALITHSFDPNYLFEQLSKNNAVVLTVFAIALILGAFLLSIEE